MTVRLQLGDITQARVDAIVNAANPSLLGGGGVDGAIHRAAGPQLLAACRALPEWQGARCPTGEARVTPGFNLPARYVIHTVGPIYHSDADPAEALTRAYQNSLHLALEVGCHALALPAISCGAYGYPAQEAADIAIAVCGQPEFAGLDITFYLFQPGLLATWQRALDQFTG